MRSKMKLGTLAFASLLIGGTGYAATQSWRPGMPAFFVDVRTADGVKMAPALILIYSELVAIRSLSVLWDPENASHFAALWVRFA